MLYRKNLPMWTMTKAILGSALFFVLVPSVIAGLIPWWMTRLGIPAAILRSAGDARFRGPVDRRGTTGAY